MGDVVPVHELISKLLTTRSCTREELKRIYKFLCKYTHPDLTGKDGADFIRLQEIYRRLAEKDRIPSEAVREDSFDPFRVLYDGGYGKITDPRTALYLSLYRYSSTGLHSYKIRSKAPFRERNALILRTVLYWAGLYKKEFVQIFIDYNTKAFEHIRVSSALKQELKAKRFFLDGLDWFFKYQDTGRSSSGKIARDKLQASLYTFRIYGYTDSPVIPFALWLKDELELPPVKFQHLR